MNSHTDTTTVYSPVGKRDPFTPIAIKSVERTPATFGIWERYPIEKLQLRAVLKGFGRSRALFEDPEGKTFVLVEGDFIGREHAILSRVIESDVIITEHTRNYLGAETLFERVLTLRPNDDEMDVWAQPEQQTLKAKGPMAVPFAITPGLPNPPVGAGPKENVAPEAKVLDEQTKPPDFGQNISNATPNIK